MESLHLCRRYQPDCWVIVAYLESNLDSSQSSYLSLFYCTHISTDNDWLFLRTFQVNSFTGRRSVGITLWIHIRCISYSHWIQFDDTSVILWCMDVICYNITILQDLSSSLFFGTPLSKTFKLFLTYLTIRVFLYSISHSFHHSLYKQTIHSFFHELSSRSVILVNENAFNLIVAS